MPLPSQYARISDMNMRCPICGKEGWCLLHRSGEQVICARVPSDDARGSMGWAHRADAGEVTMPVDTRKRRLTSFEIAEYYSSTTCPVDDPLFVNMGCILKLDPASLRSMYGGYDTDRAILTFPMFNGKLEMTGVRFRRRDGRKFSLKGGREGVFLSVGCRFDQPLIVAEGPTDCAALAELGFQNILGLPNCCGGFEVVKKILGPAPRTPVLIVSDPDDPGIAGAERLATTLVNPCMIVTGETDIRDFVIKTRGRFSARDAIMEVAGGGYRNDFRVVDCNPCGRGVNFRKVFQEK